LYSNSFSPQKKENKMNFTNFKEVFCSFAHFLICSFTNFSIPLSLDFLSKKMINFLSRLPWLLRISLISIGFFVGAILIFAGQLLIEGRPKDFFTEGVPVAYSTIGAVTFFIALLLVQKQQGKGTKFYPIFYILWITLLYIVILYYSYGEEWKENMFGYTLLFGLILIAGTPHNIIFLGLSFGLLYLCKESSS